MKNAVLIIVGFLVLGYCVFSTVYPFKSASASRQVNGNPKTECFGGHEYLITSYGLGLKISDFGAPIECEGGCYEYQELHQGPLPIVEEGVR